MTDHFQNKLQMTVGVISDTHGLLRNGVADIFKDVDLIIHAGDIGDPEIPDILNDIAPVIAVRGNMDCGEWTDDIPNHRMIAIGDARFYILHSLYDIDAETLAPVDAVISGHTHKPLIKEQDNILYINPGSAGPRRYDYPVSVAIMEVDRKKITARIVEIRL